MLELSEAMGGTNFFPQILAMVESTRYNFFKCLDSLYIINSCSLKTTFSQLHTNEHKIVKKKKKEEEEKFPLE